MPLSPNSPPRTPARLSPHFTLAQLTHSDIAAKHGINNQPSPDHLANLRRLALLLESIQTLLQHPITISSAYRNPEINRLVGGVPTSRHALGLAADLVCPGFGTPLDVARAIAASGIGLDQVIHEYGRWVHVGLAAEGAVVRGQQLTICTSEQGYLDGLLPCASVTSHPDTKG